MQIIDTNGRLVADGTRTRRVRLLVGVQHPDGHHVDAGEQTLPDDFAHLVVASGRGHFVDAAASAATPAPTAPGLIEHADPTAQTRAKKR